MIKKYKSKFGFTLIELLAVIVILAVIALIATPLVLNIIERAEKGAFKDSVYGIMEAAEFQVILTDSKYPITYVFPEDSRKIQFKGSNPTEGYLQIVNEGKIKLALGNGRWCATKEVNDSQVIVKNGKCETIDLSRPILGGYGDLNQEINMNDIYTMPNVTAVDKDGNKLNVITIIKQGDMVVDSIDTSKVCIYTITYTTEPDKDGSTSSVTVTLKVMKPETDIDKVIESGINGGGLELIGDTYYYRGSDPKNWILFEDASGDFKNWRIVNIENGVMKIMLSTNISSTFAWDSSNNNDWARPSTLNTYLNGYFKASFPSTIIDKIQEGNFYIGKINWNTSSSADTVKLEEKAVIWKGYVGLINASDYVYSSLDSSCINQALDNTACKDSWLNQTGIGLYLWTIGASDAHSSSVIMINSAGNLNSGNQASTSFHLKPVIFLKADIKIASGDGSSRNPYVIR